MIPLLVIVETICISILSDMIIRNSKENLYQNILHDFGACINITDAWNIDCYTHDTTGLFDLQDVLFINHTIAMNCIKVSYMLIGDTLSIDEDNEEN